MPIAKIPLQHKFGIVSLSKAEELLAHNRAKRPPKRSKINRPTEINQAFVAKYNAATEKGRQSLDREVTKALHYAKYKAGLVHASHPSSHQSSSNSVEKKKDPFLIDISPFDTSIAWLELTLLCQCSGPQQQEILVTLCTSLNYSPVSTAHIPSLMYISGLCYQWLKNDTFTKDVLRCGEVILLKIVYLVSLRLYYHHLTRCLMDYCTKDEIRQLKYDLEGFENKEKAYRDLPEALLHWKVALEVGLLVCENYSKAAQDFPAQSLNPPSAGSHRPDHSSSVTSEKPCSATDSIDSHGGYNISAMLWHSLDIWQCAKQRPEVLHEAIQDFLGCFTKFSADKWMDGLLTMNILCTASQLNLDTLNLVQSLALGQVKTPQPNKITSRSKSPSMDLKKDEQTSAPIFTDGKNPFPIKGTRFLLPNKMDFGFQSETQPQNITTEVTTLNILGMQPDFNLPDNESVYTADQTIISFLANGKRIYHTASADDIKQIIQNRLPKPLPSNLLKPSEATCYTTSELAAGLSTVGTQSLIANESIPDPLCSTLTSNITMLDLGSITTIDPVESLGKSIGLFTSSNSKNLDISVSNLVSPCLLPSGEFVSTDESTNGSRTGDDHVSRLSVSGKQGSDSRSVSPKKLSSRMETHSGSREQAEALDNHSFSQQATRETEEKEIHPQHVTVVLPDPKRNADSRYTHYTHSTAPLAGGANMLGSQVHPSTLLRQSVFSAQISEATTTNTQPSKTLQLKFEQWPSEIALAYTINMASIAIYGRSSLIRRCAMYGQVEKSSSEDAVDGYDQRNHGLLKLAEFQTDEDLEGIAWSIRHAAIMGLSRVCKACRSLPMKDGLSDLAWSKLLQIHAIEKDSRVSQAFDIAQVEPNMDQPMFVWEYQPSFSPLLAHMADGLSEHFLPSLSNLSSLAIAGLPNKPETKPTKVSTIQRKKLDLDKVRPRVSSERDKSKLASYPSFNTRTLENLNEIAKEDWRRQMQQEQKREKVEMVWSASTALEVTV